MYLIILFMVGYTSCYNKKRIWLDCDPGNGDALAIIYAMFQDQLEIIGISTSYGQYTLEATTANAVRILGNLNGFKIPLVKGLDKPINSCFTQSNNEGLYNASVFDVNFVPIQSAKPTEELRTQVKHRAKGQNFTLVLMGPHSNFGSLFQQFDDNYQIEEIIIVGGDPEVCDPNFALDPLATEVVLSYAQRRQIRITIFPKYLTQNFSKESFATLEQLRSKLGDWIAGAIKSDQEKVYEIFVIHFLLQPSQFITQSKAVDIVNTADCQAKTIFNQGQQLQVVDNFRFRLDQFVQSINKASKVALMRV